MNFRSDFQVYEGLLRNLKVLTSGHIIDDVVAQTFTVPACTK